MNPRRIHSREEKEEIRRLLMAFYARKPASYGLAGRPQEEYEAYASLLHRYARTGGRVLDFGCGTDRSPAAIARRGFAEVVGCDLGFGATEDAPPAALAGDGWKFVRLSGIALPFPAGHFDVVASLCVLEHLVDVGEHLAEADRVLKPGGVLVVVGPNWSGPNNPLKGLYATLVKRTRYWRYETVWDALTGVFRSLIWYGEAFMAREPRFQLIAPRTIGGGLLFETGDDDCVHLCHPLTFKRWLGARGYALLRYNRGAGKRPSARLFNTLLPSLATTNVIVARKPTIPAGNR
jgi:SAM-dependent methyltransferase